MNSTPGFSNTKSGSGSMKYSLCTLLVTVFALSGCSTGGSSQLGDDYSQVYAETEGVQRRALVIGMTAVDPGSYGGWDGACPGADVDADVVSQLCLDQGLQLVTYYNQEATWARTKAAALAATKGMRPGDLFVIFIAGHGGQKRDYGGDEADGYDETLLLWDGEITDDQLLNLWESMPKGVRVLYITDTCNSGTNYRSRRDYRRTIPRDFRGALVHIGGCSDGESSFGSAQGGIMTTALIDAWEEGIGLWQWYIAMVKRMPEKQAPIWAEFGNVDAEFRLGAALQ